MLRTIGARRVTHEPYRRNGFSGLYRRLGRQRLEGSRAGEAVEKERIEE